MSKEKADLSIKGSSLYIKADFGYVYSPSFDNITNLDTEYLLVLDEGLDSEVSYTVGNGLVIVPERKSIVWALDTREMEQKKYRGYLKSISDIAGTALHIYLTLDLT